MAGVYDTCGCTHEEILKGSCTAPEGCKSSLDLMCAFYNGEPLTTLNIYKGMSGEESLVMIDSFLESFMKDVDMVFAKYRNVGAGKSIYKGLSNRMYHEFKSIKASKGIKITETENEIELSLDEPTLKTTVPYRVVKTISERDNIPTEERVLGLTVTVIDENFQQYMLQGLPATWVKVGVQSELIQNSYGHVTVSDNVSSISKAGLNSKFPDAKEGFRVTYTALSTTFMKVFNGEWVMTNNKLV